MAVTRIATPNRYVGLSTDAKPTTDVPAGSRFTERDTGLTYVWDLTAWGVTSISARQNTWTALQTYSANGIGTTPTDRIVLTNTTAAAAGAQQISPAMHFHGSGWKTNAAAAAQDVDARVYLVPVQGAANPSSYLTWEFAVNGGAYGEQLRLSSDGTLTVQGFRAPDGVLVTLGTDGDQVELNHAAGLAADTALTNVLLLTTAGSRQAFAANSRIVSNVTLNGDYGVYVNVAGVSKEAVFVDASAKTITLGFGLAAGRIDIWQDVRTDRWLTNYTNTFLGEGVVSGDTLAHGVSNEGWYNTIIGGNAGRLITTGWGNTLVGAEVGDRITTGYNNTGVGMWALFYVTTGFENTAVGRSAGLNITTGEMNVCIGDGSGSSITTGSQNTFLGRHSGYDATKTNTASNNVAVGWAAGRFITSGTALVFVGYNAGQSNTTGGNNTFIGASAGDGLSTGSGVTAIGRAALFNATTSSDNTAVGDAAGWSITTGASNTFVGSGAGNNASQLATASNSIGLGKGVFTTQSNQFRVGVGTTLWLDYDGRTTGATAYTRLTMPFLAPTLNDAAGAQYVALLLNGGTVTYAGTTTVTGQTVPGVAAGNLTLATSGAGITVNSSMVFWARATIPAANVTLPDSYTYWTGNPSAAAGTFTRLHGFFSEALTRATNNSQYTWQTGGAAPAVTTNLVQTAAVDFAADDARLYVVGELAASAPVIIGGNQVRTGLAGTATGSFVMSGSTSGVVTLTVAAAAGTYTLTAPALGSNATIAVLETAQTFTALQTYSANGIGTTPTDRIALTNTTAAAAGAQQVSPAMHWTGQGWKTDATAASQALDAREYLVPVQGAANPSSYLTWEFAVNGGAYAEKLRLSSVGILTVQGSTASTSAATGSLVVKGGMGVGNGTAAGTTAALYVGHDDATNAASHARIVLSVTHGSADPFLTFSAGSDVSIGLDNSATGDALEIVDGSVMGTNVLLRINRVTTVLTTGGKVMTNVAGTGMVLSNGADRSWDGLRIGAHTNELAGTITVTTVNAMLRVGVLTIAQSGGAVTMNAAAGVVSISPTAGASVTLTHSSAFRALTGGAAVNVSGMYFEAQTAGTTGNYQALFAVSTGAAPALADHVGVNAQDFAADDTRLYIQSQAGSAIIIGNNAVRTGLAGTATGSFVMSGLTSGVVTLTVAAAAGTWTMTLPAAVGGAGQQLADLAGNGITGWTDAASRREYKQEITGFVDYQGALQKMLQSPLYTFRYRPGTGHGTGDYDTRYLGVMAGESDWAMHFDGSIVNPVNTVGYMVAGFRAINEVQESQETRIIRLEARVAELEARLAA